MPQKIKSIQLHDSIARFSQKIVSFTLHYITLYAIFSFGQFSRSFAADITHGCFTKEISPLLYVKCCKFLFRNLTTEYLVDMQNLLYVFRIVCE